MEKLQSPHVPGKGKQIGKGEGREGGRKGGRLSVSS